VCKFNDLSFEKGQRAKSTGRRQRLLHMKEKRGREGSGLGTGGWVIEGRRVCLLTSSGDMNLNHLRSVEEAKRWEGGMLTMMECPSTTTMESFKESK
jgi:hypothetical protein